MVLARQSRVLKIIGSPSTQEQSGLDIAGAITDADEIVFEYTRTDADDWVEGVTFGFAWAREAAEKWAAARLLEEWQDMNQKSDKYRKESDGALANLRKMGYGSKDGDNPSFYSTVTPYKTVGSSTSASGIIYGGPRYLSRNAFGGDYD